MISESRRDYYAGGLMFLIGCGAAVIGTTYKVGSLTQMGPGFFPVCLGVMVAGMGVLIALAASAGAKAGADIMDAHHALPSHPDWRGWGCIIGSVAAFIILAEYAGLAPATFACVFIGASGDNDSSVKASAFLAAGITAFAILLFSYVLHVQIPIVKGL